MNRFHPSMSWNESTTPHAREDNDDCSSSSPPDWATAHDMDFDVEEIDETSGEDSAILVGQAVPDHRGQGSRQAGTHRSFFLPLHYEPNYRYPLIVWLHSDGFNENQVDHVMPYVSIRNYVAVGVRGVRAADSAGHRFDWHDSSAAIAAADESVAETIAEASARFSIHASRIILAGYGSGGTMALRLGLSNPHRFAAVVSMGGSMPSESHIVSNLSELRQRRMPMLWQWGSHARQFDPERLKRDIRLAMMIKAAVEIRQYPVGDEFDSVAFADLNDWIMRRVIADQSIQSDDRWATSPTTYSSN